MIQDVWRKTTSRMDSTARVGLMGSGGIILKHLVRGVHGWRRGGGRAGDGY